MGRMVPSVIPASATRPALTKGEVRVEGCSGGKIPSSPPPCPKKDERQLFQYIIRGFPLNHDNMTSKKKKKLASEGVNSHAEDIPDNIYLNAFAPHFP